MPTNGSGSIENPGERPGPTPGPSGRGEEVVVSVTVHSVDELVGLAGTDLGYSDWVMLD